MSFWILFEKTSGPISLVDENGNILYDSDDGKVLVDDPSLNPEGEEWNNDDHWVNESLYGVGIERFNIENGPPVKINGAFGYAVRGCELISKKYSSRIGGAKVVSISMTTQIGGSNDIDSGVAFIDS